MDLLPASEEKTHLLKILDRMAAGERIAISRHGVPVAILQPVDRVKAAPVDEVIAELKRFRKGRSSGGLTVREMIEAGRR